MRFTRAIATVGGLTLVSRIAGFIRDLLTAVILGAGPVADAFFVALKLPNFFRRLFAEGAFSAAFVPLLSGRQAKAGDAAATALTEQALSLMVAILLPLTVLGLVFMPAVVTVLAPGFADEPARFERAVDLARVTFPYLLLISLVALFGGVLNVKGRFAPFAAAPIAFNLCLVAALIAAWQGNGDVTLYMAYGVAVAGIIQFIWLFLSLARAGIRLRLIPPRLTRDMKRLLTLMGPGMIGAGVVQINLMIDVILASLLPAGAISALYYADRLHQLPLGVIGIAIGTALLPALSRAIQTDDSATSVRLFSRAIEFAMLLALPAALGLAVLAAPITGTLFQYGAFGDTERVATAAALMGYAVGIPGYVLVKVYNAAYFARQDTVTPVKAGIVVAIGNTALSLSLIPFLGHAGIALATGLSAWLHCALLGWRLRGERRIAVEARLSTRLWRIGASGVVMAAVTGTLAWGVPLAFDLPALTSLPAVERGAYTLGIITLGATTYFLTALLLGAASLSEFRQSFRRGRSHGGADETDGVTAAAVLTERH